MLETTAGMRPCVVERHGSNPQKAVFHCFGQFAEVIAPSLLKGGHGGGQLANIMAVVEYPDGKVDEIPAYCVRFTDRTEGTE